MLTSPPVNQLELQWWPALDTYDPVQYAYEEFRLLLLVDGEPLLDVFDDLYGFDLGELVGSLTEGGFYTILTCECGEAGCAGITEPVAVVHGAEYVEWHVTSPWTRSLRFAYGPYAAAIHAARQQLLAFMHRAYAGLREGDVMLRPFSYWHWPFVQDEDWSRHKAG